MTLSRHLLLLCLVTLAVYFSSLFNSFVWDDEQFIYRNQFVANFDILRIFTTNTIAGAGEVSNYYRPLTTLSFAIDYQFWGLNPLGYHLVNIFLHIGAGIFLYLLLLRLSFQKFISFWITLFFLLHPVQTEAVTYINSRGDSLYSFFGLASLLCFVNGLQQVNWKHRLYNLQLCLTHKHWYFLSLILFILSILSKEIALALLGLFGLLFLNHYLVRHKHLHMKEVFAFLGKQSSGPVVYMSLITIAGIYLLLRSSVLNFQNTFNFFDDTSLYSSSLLVRLLTFCKILFIYIKIIFIPFPLHMERSVNIIESIFSPWLFASVLLVITLFSLGWYQWRKNQQTTILFGTVWFFSMLVPVSGIIAINGLLYEHWLYLPIIGVFIILYGFAQLVRIKFSKGILYGGVLLAVAYSVLTVRQNYFWSSPVRLYTYLLRYTDSARIHNNLAMAYSEEGKYQEALVEYNKALEFGMAYPQIYHNMANTYRTLEEFETAEKYYQQALTLDPSFFHSYNNLIKLYSDQKKYDSAIEYSKKAQTYFPNNFEYQLVELQLYIQKQNKAAFNDRKAELQQIFKDDPRALQLLSAIEYQ